MHTACFLAYLPEGEGKSEVQVELTVVLDGSIADGWSIETLIVAPFNCCWLGEDGWTQETADAHFWDREQWVLDRAVAKIWEG